MKNAAKIPLLFLVLALTLAACGGTDDEPAPDTGPASEVPVATGETVSVVATEFAFAPADLTAPADTDVTLSVENQGNVEHDLTIRDQDVQVIAMPGETGTGTFNLSPGEYQFYCSIPGHEAAGMLGTITVE